MNGWTWKNNEWVCLGAPYINPDSKPKVAEDKCTCTIQQITTGGCNCGYLIKQSKKTNA